MTSDENMQVQFDELHGAVRALPDQVSALGDTRQLLTSRHVSPEAFGDVPDSPLAGAAHADTVSTTEQGLNDASGRLDRIIGGMRDAGERVREYDTAQATGQQQQTQQLQRELTIRFPDGRTMQAGPGDWIVPRDAEVLRENGTVVTPQPGYNSMQMFNGPRIDWVPEESDVPSH